MAKWPTIAVVPAGTPTAVVVWLPSAPNFQSDPLVPLVGFDAGGYRLGYGGGYYDRSLAARTPRPLAIGIGFEISRLATIHPQPHDIPMDAIVTERGMLRIRVQEGTP